MSSIKWGYSMSQWNTYSNTARREEIERAFKVISICSCRGVELVVGTSRWEPLGRPELIDINFGSPQAFNSFLKACNLDKVTGWYYDPGMPSLEENSFYRNPSDPSHHQGIVDALLPFAQYLKALDGEYILVRPMGSYWRHAPITEEMIRQAGACWNKVGQMTREYGIRTIMHIDWLCAIHSEADIASLLNATDPKLVGFAVDTAELTIAGLDPIAIYEKFADRTELFHFKDVQVTDTLDEYKNELADNILQNGGKRKIGRWYWEMGRAEGLVNFPELMKRLYAKGYDGWVIIDSSQSPNPAESAMLNNWYIKNVLTKTGTG